MNCDRIFVGKHPESFCKLYTVLLNVRYLFDGQRAWLVDWEAAFLNDLYADLAVAANLVVSNDAEQRLYLQEYFGQPPDPYQSARFFLMQQLAHMFYAMAYMLQGSSGKQLDGSEPAPEYGDFHRRFWAGEVNLADNDLKIVYGMVHWEQLVRNMRQTRFDEALGIVSERNTSQEGVRLLLPGVRVKLPEVIIPIALLQRDG